MIKDELMIEQKTNFLQTKCFACSSKSHVASECPMIHFIPDRMRIVKNFLKDPGQKRRISYQRPKKNKFNSLFSLKYMKDRHLRFQQLSFYYTSYGENWSEISSPVTAQSFLIKNNLRNHINEEDNFLSEKNLQAFNYKKDNTNIRRTISSLGNLEEDKNNEEKNNFRRKLKISTNFDQLIEKKSNQKILSSKLKFNNCNSDNFNIPKFNEPSFFEKIDEIDKSFEVDSKHKLFIHEIQDSDKIGSYIFKLILLKFFKKNLKMNFKVPQLN